MYTYEGALRKKCPETSLKENCVAHHCAIWKKGKQVCKKCGFSNACQCKDRQPIWVDTGYCGLIKE